MISEDQLPLEARTALALGRMTMRFNALEYLTREMLLWILDDLPRNEVHAMTAELSFRKLRDVILALCHERYGESAGWLQLRSVLREVVKLEERRNTLTHSVWDYTELPAALHRTKARVTGGGTFQRDREPFSDVDSLNDFVKSIDEVTRRLVACYQEHFLTKA